MDKPWTFDDSPEVLDEDACLCLLQSRDLGRIAFTVNGLPDIFPVNYAVEGRIVVFRTGPGRMLDVVPKTPVAFEVDSWDPGLGTGWSVVVKGRAEEVTASGGRAAHHLRQALVHPAAPGLRQHWLAIKPSEVTGRSFHVRPGARRRHEAARTSPVRSSTSTSPPAPPPPESGGI